MEVTIDFGRSLSGSFAALVRHFGSFLMLTAGWFFLGIATFFSTQIAVLHAVESWPEFREMIAASNEKLVELILVVPIGIVSIVGTVSMVIGWHRRVIQGIVPDGPFPIGIGSLLAYAWRGLLVFGVPGLPFVLTLVGLRELLPPDPAKASMNPLVAIWIFVGIVAVSLVAMRLGVVLPAIAVGDRTITLVKAWRLTKGNTLKLFFGAFLAALPFSIVANIGEKVAELPAIAQSDWQTVAYMLGGFSDLLSYAAVAGFFSLAYVQLREALDEVPTTDPLRVSST